MPVCRSCSVTFDFPAQFAAVLEKISPRFGDHTEPVPLPTLCPDCRYQRRLAHRNEWQLYRGRCAATGKTMVSIYSENKPYTVYSQSYWWGDGWDARNFAREFDFSRPFFDQFADLQLAVPRLAAVNTNSENSEYTNQCCENKDSYLSASCSYNEKVLYGYWNQNSRECVDCYGMERCELCYECLNSAGLYNCAYVSDSEDSNNCWFCDDCRSCSNVVGSQGLRGKNHYWFNQPLTPEEWKHRFAELNMTPGVIGRLLRESSALRRAVPKKYYHGRMNEHFSGDYLFNCRDTYVSFNCKECWDVWYSQDAWRMKDCSDVTEALDTERCYEIEGAIANSCAWVTKSWPIHDAYYCDLCFGSGDLFGCVGMRNAAFCILNKQYTRDEYYRLAQRIVAHMRETGEWGEHFPARLSPFCYNETVAQDYFPLSHEQVLQRGWRWKDESGEALKSNSCEPAAFPEKITDVSDAVLKEVLRCGRSGRPFRIVPQELTFYRKMNLPLPSIEPAERRRSRLMLRNARRLWAAQCMHIKDDGTRCPESFETSYHPQSGELVYCEQCYLQSVY